MGEILSQAEVEAILSAIEPSRPGSPRPSALTPEPEWEPHDFHRAQPLQGTALKLIHALHEGICQRWQQRLESMLQAYVCVRAVGACQSNVVEFLATLSSACIHYQIAHTRSTSPSLLIWSADLAHSLIARILGDTEGRSDGTCGAMTSIERRLLARLNDVVLDELSSLLGEQLQVSAVLESSKPNDPASQFSSIWFSFEVACGAKTGLIHLGVPTSSMSPQETSATTIEPDAIPPGIRQVTVQVSANLASLKLKTSDLAALQVGDLVMTDMSTSESISLQLDGQTLCQATMGTHLGRKALRLSEPVRK